METAEASPEDAAKARKRKVLVVAVGAAVAIAVIGGGMAFMLGGNKGKPTPNSGNESVPEQKGDSVGGTPKSEDKKLRGIDFGDTYTFQPFHLNLGNPLENRYIRLEIAAEVRSGAAKEEIVRRLPQLRGAVISVASRKTREFLLGPDGKAQLRGEILNGLNVHMKNKIDNIYVTDILIE